jgi:hypothetical protein
LPNFYILISVFFFNTGLCEMSCLLHPPATVHIMHASLVYAHYFGELLWDAIFGSNF